MYIVTFEEFDRENEAWYEKCRIFNGKDYIKDFIKYSLELEAYGLVRRIHIFEGREIPYTHNVTVELDIDWK